MSKTNRAMFCNEMYSHTSPTVQNHTNSTGEDIRKILPGEDIPKSLNHLPKAPIAPFKLRERKYFEPQVPDKSGSYDFSSTGYKEYLDCCYGISTKPCPPSNASELPLSRCASEKKFNRSKDFNPAAADGRKSTQLSPQIKKLTISDPEEVPRRFHEPFNKKYFEPQVSEISYASEIVTNSGEYNIDDKRTCVKTVYPSEESSRNKVKLQRSVPSKCDNVNPSVLLNKTRTESFPSRITEYLNEQNKNIAHFKSRVCDFLQHQIQAIKNGTMIVEKITEYGNFFDSSIFLSQDDLAEMENSNDKVHLKNVLEHNASIFKCLAEQNLQLIIFSNHAKSWLEKASVETKEHLERVKIKSSMQRRSIASGTTAEVNDLICHHQNKSKEKKKVADYSTMTSIIVSEDDDSSHKKSRTVAECGNNKHLLSQDKKIARVRNASTMTESLIEMNHPTQQKKHNLSAESRLENFNSRGKNSHKLNKTCDSSTKTNHVSKRKTKSTDSHKTCDSGAMTNHVSKRKTKPKESHSNKGETSDNTVNLCSCDKKNQKVKCCNSSTTTDSLLTKKSFKETKRETSVCIRVTQNEPISSSEDQNKPKQCTTSTMTSNVGIGNFESIVDKALGTMFVFEPAAENSEKTSSALHEFIVTCCTTEEIVEHQSSASEALGSGLNSSVDSSSNDEKSQLSANVSDQSLEGHKSSRSNHSTNSVRKDSLSKELKASCTENDLKHHREGRCYSYKRSQRDCSSRIEKVGDSSSTRVDDSNKEKEVFNCSRSIDMYGLSSPNLSFATINYLTRHGLVNSSSKARSPQNEKK